MDYLVREEEMDLMGWCIATRDQVKSVMLFSKGGWRDLEGRRIGITDDTATSVHLLNVLLEKKYGVHATLERLHQGVNAHDGLDAVLLIGDEALRRNKEGLDGFELVYDLAREWYEWQKLPSSSRCGLCAGRFRRGRRRSSAPCSSGHSGRWGAISFRWRGVTAGG